jgi:ribosomal protein S12 methylthiotransferase accessory factor
MSTMTVSFPGGVAVEATFKGHTVRTDQPVKAGGADTAMAPFDLFLASIATCMGYYAVSFCRERGIPTEGLGLTLEPIRDEEAKRVAELRIRLDLPPGFPEKYRSAIERAVDHCAVKKHVLEPPRFELTVMDAGAEVPVSS